MVERLSQAMSAALVFIQSQQKTEFHCHMIKLESHSLSRVAHQNLQIIRKPF